MNHSRAHRNVNRPGIVSRVGVQAALQHWLDCRRLRNNRQSYYRYLADLLHGLRGGRSLRDIFLLDSVRHGPHSWRGRLYAGWAAMYEASGGDLYAIWVGAVPGAELGVLRSAQARGNEVFKSCLSELAQALEHARRTQNMLTSTLLAAGVAVVLVIAVLLALPFHTVPELLGAFNAVSPQHYGPRTRALVGFSEAIRVWSLLVLPALGLLVWLTLWSFDSFTGAVRARLDRFSIWWVYRNIQAQRVLAMLVIVLGRDDYGPVQLRTALQLLREGASPWLSWQLNMLVQRLDQGMAPEQVFQTGLLDREQAWYLADMIGARGLCGGMAIMSDKLHEYLQRDIARKALRLRWLLLLACVGAMLSLTFWHYAVIDELRRSLVSFYAGH